MKHAVILTTALMITGCQIQEPITNLSGHDHAELFAKYPLHKGTQSIFDHWTMSKSTKIFYRKHLALIRRVAATFHDPVKYINEQENRVIQNLFKKKHYNNVSIKLYDEKPPHTQKEIQLLDIRRLAVMVVERPIHVKDMVDQIATTWSAFGGQRYKHRDLMLVAFTYGKRRYAKQIGWNTSQEIATKYLFTKALIDYDKTKKIKSGIRGSNFDRNTSSFVAATGFFPFDQFEMGIQIIADSKARMQRLTALGAQASFIPQLWRGNWGLTGEQDKINEDGIILDADGNPTNHYSCISLQIAALNQIFSDYFDNDPSKLRFHIVQGF